MQFLASKLYTILALFIQTAFPKQFLLNIGGSSSVTDAIKFDSSIFSDDEDEIISESANTTQTTAASQCAILPENYKIPVYSFAWMNYELKSKKNVNQQFLIYCGGVQDADDAQSSTLSQLGSNKEKVKTCGRCSASSGCRNFDQSLPTFFRDQIWYDFYLLQEKKAEVKIKSKNDQKCLKIVEDLVSNIDSVERICTKEMKKFGCCLNFERSYNVVDKAKYGNSKLKQSKLGVNNGQLVNLGNNMIAHVGGIRDVYMGKKYQEFVTREVFVGKLSPNSDFTDFDIKWVDADKVSKWPNMIFRRTGHSCVTTCNQKPGQRWNDFQPEITAVCMGGLNYARANKTRDLFLNEQFINITNSSMSWNEDSIFSKRVEHPRQTEIVLSNSVQAELNEKNAREIEWKEAVMLIRNEEIKQKAGKFRYLPDATIEIYVNKKMEKGEMESRRNKGLDGEMGFCGWMRKNKTDDGNGKKVEDNVVFDGCWYLLKTTMNKPRTSFATILIDSKIYIFGGETCVDRQASSCLNEKMDTDFDGSVEVLELNKSKGFPINMLEAGMVCNRASHTASLYQRGVNRFVILEGGRVRPPKNSTLGITQPRECPMIEIFDVQNEQFLTNPDKWLNSNKTYLPIIEDSNAPANFRKEHASMMVDVDDDFLLKVMNLTNMNESEIEQRLACDVGWFNKVSSSSVNHEIHGFLMLFMVLMLVVYSV